MNALFRSTRGTSGSEYLTLGATIAMVGIGGFVAFGGAMNDSIVGQTSSGASLPSDGVALSAAAALSDDQEKAVRDRLEDEGVLEELEAAGVDIETLDEHPNLAQYLADRGVTDDVILSVYDALGEELPGFDPGGSGLNTPNPNPTPNQDVTLNADDVDFSDLQGQLAELGEGHILGDQVMPDSTQFEAQCGHLAGQARATCLASAAGLEQNAPEDFSPTFGAGLWHDFAGSFMDNLKGIASSTWNAITHPVDTFKGLAYMVTHPGAAWDGLKAYWGDNCGAGVLTGECLGMISAEGAFGVLTGLAGGGAGRLIHRSKMGLVRNFPALAMTEGNGLRAGLRNAAGRVFYGPFGADEFTTGDIRRVLPYRRGRFDAARYLQGFDEADDARIIAQQIRKGQTSLHTPSRMLTDLRRFADSDGFIRIADLPAEIRATLTSHLDDYVQRSPLTATDRSIRNVARDRSGLLGREYTLQNKLDGVVIRNNNLDLVFRDGVDLSALRGGQTGRYAVTNKPYGQQVSFQTGFRLPKPGRHNIGSFWDKAANRERRLVKYPTWFGVEAVNASQHVQ